MIDKKTKLVEWYNLANMDLHHYYLMNKPNEKWDDIIVLSNGKMKTKNVSLQVSNNIAFPCFWLICSISQKIYIKAF